MEDKLGFASGQPLEPHERDGFGRTLEDAARDAETAMRDKRNRFYKRPGSPERKRLDDRIMGELDK